MSKRITVKDLELEVIKQNEFLAHSGSNIYAVVKQRNNYTAIDRYYIDENGVNCCDNYVECGTPRECLSVAYGFNSDNHKKVFHGTTITRKTAKTILMMQINFNKDPAQLRQSELELLHTWAKITKYKKPVNFSRGYGFFIHLQKRVKL